MASLWKAYNKAGFIAFGLNVVGELLEGGKRHKKPKPPAQWQLLTTKTAKLRQDHNAVAIRTGQESAILVLDVDDVNGWESLLAELGHESPKTVTQQSQSGGIHYFFRWEPRFDNLPSRNTKVIRGMDIDLRGKGGMIFVAPTTVRYPDGTVGEYKWVEGKGLLDREPAVMPTWLFDELTRGGQAQAPAAKDQDQPAAVETRQQDTASSGSGDRYSVKFSAPAALVSFLEIAGIDNKAVRGVGYSPELHHYCVSTDETLCMFVKRLHQSNKQYFIINEAGEKFPHSHPAIAMC